MNKDEFDLAVKNMECLEGGIKEACLIVRNYLSNKEPVVSLDDFNKAVEVLMAYAWTNKENDCIPETWYCDNDCTHCGSFFGNYFCPGEFQLGKKDKDGKYLTKNRCPYFRDSQYI